MDYTPYSLLIDVGFISILMIVGTFMRRHFAWFRHLLIPAPITAGLLGLLLGPEVLGILKFSETFMSQRIQTRANYDLAA